MQHAFAIAAEAACAIRHQALALRGADGGAEVRLARQARLTLAAFGRVERDNVIALLQARHAGAHVNDNASTLMAKHAGKQALGIRARQRVVIGVANAGCLHLDHDFASLGAVHIDLDNLERFFGRKGDGSAGLHGVRSPAGMRPDHSMSSCPPLETHEGRAVAVRLSMSHKFHGRQMG